MTNCIPVSDARRQLITLELRSPLITAALREMQGLAGRATLSDFPTITLVEAAYAAKLQVHGYEVLRGSAQAGSAAAGAAGAEAALVLGQQFDFEASEAILLGRAVLPLLQLALHFWYLSHSPPLRAAESKVLIAARRIDLAPGGVFDPRTGLSEFRDAYADALGTSTSFEIPYHDVHVALTRAIAAASTWECATVNGQRVSWDSYQHDALLSLDARPSELRYTAGELTALLRGLMDFALAHGKYRELTGRYTAAV